MNPPTTFEVVAFKTSKKNKRALINYTAQSGKTITRYMNDLLEEALAEEERPKLKGKQSIVRFRSRS